MTDSIAIVGMACVYPDARSPAGLWENALAGRRAFRRIPSERLRLEDYFSTDPGAADCTYSSQAALIEGYEFDRVRFRVSGNSFRSADPAHWLALDVAAQSLSDAGFQDGEGLPRARTGVFLGNTLTGDFTRANVMRLRWPYVRRVVEAALADEGWPPDELRAFSEKLEGAFKQPFPAISEESLAGGLSNTIAGRICNYFDLKGGGFTIDGACASSLLAVTNACSSLAGGDLDVAIAGGVDLSIDPFELVGFAKAGALAAEKMRVFDARSAGFWPGEGCGLVVLMRCEDAQAGRRRIHAIIRGWGVSSDGSGGITRPEVEGQLLALRRAYHRAGYSAGTVAYFEGHGTGTSVGDATELKALSLARRESAPDAAAAIGSIKANIGHTKAAAGIAGLIKAAMALDAQILPPTTGCEEPHPELKGESPALRALTEGEPWRTDRPLRAGVSAMGFGGINTHVTLEGAGSERRKEITTREKALLCSAQDCELFLLRARDAGEMQRRVEKLLAFAAKISQSEMTDLAVELKKIIDRESAEAAPLRAAVVASSPSELSARLETLGSWLTSGAPEKIDVRSNVFLGGGRAAPRIGFLFPGQGSRTHIGGGAWRRRFDFVRELYEMADIRAGGDEIATAVAQPAIMTASMAGLRMLEKLRVTACVAVGHSLGEITALHWAGALDETALLRTARARGAAMTKSGGPAGAMASIRAGEEEVESLINGHRVVIAGLNSPAQTVVSGEAAAIANFVASAKSRGLGAIGLPVSHAFHSPLVAAAAPLLDEHLARERFQPLRRSVVSTVTGNPIATDEDLRKLLYRQVTSPVRFYEAISKAAEGLDLLIEVGPGEALSGIAGEFVAPPAVALDAGGTSLRGLLQAAGAAFASGAPIDHEVLFAGRFARPFNLDWRPRFFVNPCEMAPPPNGEARRPGAVRRLYEKAREDKTDAAIADSPAPEPPATTDTSAKELLRRLVAQRAELPLSAVKDDNRLLGDLHLNSITVSQLISEAARSLGLPTPIAPTDYSNVTISEAACALDEMAGAGAPLPGIERRPQGVDSWLRSFSVELVERALPRRQEPTGQGAWKVIAPDGYRLAAPLREAFASWGGDGGVILCVPPEPDERHVRLLLEGARAALTEERVSRFVLVQHGGGGGAFARTLCLELPEMTTCVVDVPMDHPESVKWAIAEAKAAVGYSEAYYDSAGRRREPVLRLLPACEESGGPPLGPNDVLLVTGGGKGIAAECALSLARETGACLALLGRSRPDEDAELAANLDRMTHAGIRLRYYAADVTSVEAVRAAVGAAQAELGAVTAFLHGAGVNVPQLLSSIDEDQFVSALAPKLQGARNALAAINPDRLRLFITFGSLIARTGMRGEAHYATANEWLARLVERWRVEHPRCRCLNLEWSVWAGAGMGQRLGKIDALMRQGITPIPLEEGIRILRRLLGQRLPSVSVVITGRFGDTPTLKLEKSELPFLRFLDQPKVYYPGVELVVDAELSANNDPYLDDHVFQGERLFPAVMGLEAMAQVAMALAEVGEPPVFEDVGFDRPIVVPSPGSMMIRLAALVREPGKIEVVMRSAGTAFQADHFRAVCRFGTRDSEDESRGSVSNAQESVTAELLPMTLDPKRELYGEILFHKGRFQRLCGYRLLRAKQCLAEISPDGAPDWFSRYLPTELTLGDPAARDAAIHAIQACIPHATLLPVGVDRIVIDSTRASERMQVKARERLREGDTFIYDVEVSGEKGETRERWKGLRLRVVDDSAVRDGWAEPLLGPYIERRIEELVSGAEVSVIIERRSSLPRASRSDLAIQRALGMNAPVRRRPDGKPEVMIDRSVEVSAAHAGDLTMAVAGSGPIACDVEMVAARSNSMWRELLSQDGFALSELIARETGEDINTVATRIWAARECLKKAGAVVAAPLMLYSLTPDGWVRLASGKFILATYLASIRGIEDKIVFGLLVRRGDAIL